jgi:hypothetical protein
MINFQARRNSLELAVWRRPGGPVAQPPPAIASAH